jgi:hypothetical protein
LSAGNSPEGGFTLRVELPAEPPMERR